MIAIAPLKILVTVFVLGQPPVMEMLPKEYPANQIDRCVADTKAIIATVREGVKARAACVEADTEAL